MMTDYPNMLRTGMEVQRAAAMAYTQLASRWWCFSADQVLRLAKLAARPLELGPEERQNATEDAIWAAYIAHEEIVRALSGAWRLGLLVFLNELDLCRGPQNGGERR